MKLYPSIWRRQPDDRKPTERVIPGECTGGEKCPVWFNIDPGCETMSSFGFCEGVKREALHG